MKKHVIWIVCALMLVAALPAPAEGMELFLGDPLEEKTFAEAELSQNGLTMDLEQSGGESDDNESSPADSLADADADAAEFVGMDSNGEAIETIVVSKDATKKVRLDKTYQIVLKKGTIKEIPHN